jgi:hypothetical protein
VEVRGSWTQRHNRAPNIGMGSWLGLETALAGDLLLERRVWHVLSGVFCLSSFCFSIAWCLT